MNTELIPSFGNPFASIEEELENMVEEVIEFQKGDFKTIVTIRFTRDGYPISCMMHTTNDHLSK